MRIVELHKKNLDVYFNELDFSECPIGIFRRAARETWILDAKPIGIILVSNDKV